jgi:hypothetical protein
VKAVKHAIGGPARPGPRAGQAPMEQRRAGGEGNRLMCSPRFHIGFCASPTTAVPAIGLGRCHWQRAASRHVPVLVFQLVIRLVLQATLSCDSLRLDHHSIVDHQSG